MAANDDFTFCRVGPLIDEVEAEKVADDIKGIHIQDGDKRGVDNSEIHTNDGDQNASDRSRNRNGGSIWEVSTSSQKQGKVGSLSFNVVDASPRKEPEKKTPVRKSAPRAKVPFEKGYSPMDWLKLTQTHPDLAGLKGQSNRRVISMSEVKQHQSEGSMWTVLKGHVYNISPYMKFHPGGVDMLMKAVGKDCTSLFNKYHAWVNAEFLMEKCLVGILDEGQ